MSIDEKLSQINKIVTEQTNEASNLKTAIENSWTEVAKVHDLAKQNHQAARDWQTKTGQVTFKDLNDAEYQVDTLTTLINETQKINPHPEVMTKAQFDALRQMRKQQYAGSGFVEWGKSFHDARFAINEGMHAFGGINQNRMVLGPATHTPKGNSKTLRPTILIDGVQHNLGYVRAVNELDNNVYFPPAPDGTKTYDSATGKVTQHASAAEAFNECRHKAPNVVHAGIYNNELGEFTFQQTGVGGLYFVNKTNTEAHKVHIVFTSSVDTNIEFRDATGAIGADPLIKSFQASANIKHTVTFNHTFRNSGVYLRAPEAQVGQKITIHSWESLPATEQVITSRKDLVLLESWHEKIADKDVVYPLGNVQFGASTYEGIGLANNLVAQGYCAFGEWDTDTKGYGVKWSTLSAANRVKFLKNPEHNIYYAPEAKAYIQVRYRVRVVEGLADEWADPLTLDEGFFLREKGFNRLAVVARGKVVEFNDRTTGLGSRDSYIHKNRSYAWVNEQQYPIGEGAIYATDGMLNDFGHESKCFAIPIALVQRLNQGAYHPVHNPMGCDRWIKQDVIAGNWHSHNEFINSSQSQAFFEAIQPGKSGRQRAGSISSGLSGRRDQYKYYDAIYAGQVEDLRLNANKLDVNQLREDTMRKAVAGTLRGKARLMVTRFDSEVYQLGGSGLGYVQIDTNGWLRPRSPHEKLYGWNMTKNKAVSIYQSASSPHVFNVYMDDESAIAVGDKIMISYYRSKQSAEFDSLPWTDIVGHPERIAATFPDGVIGQWIPIVPPDSQQSFPLNKKYSGGFSNVVTLNNGDSWVVGGAGVLSDIKNEWKYTSQSNEVRLVFYKTSAAFTQSAANSEVISHITDAWVGNDSRQNFGNRLQQSLTGKVAQVMSYTTNAYTPVMHKNLLDNKLLQDEFPIHAPCPSLGGDSGAFGCKALPTITQKNGLYYLQLHGAQIQHDRKPIIDISESSTEPKLGYQVFRVTDGPLKGRLLKRMFHTATAVPFNSLDWSIDTVGLKYQGNADYSFKFFTDSFNWGDDNAIPVLNGENVKTDLNGNTVKVFCHHTQLPLGIASH